MSAHHRQPGVALACPLLYTEGAGDLDPEIRDISGTFAPIDPQPVAPIAARPRPAATAWRERHHQGPMFVVDGSNIACVGRDIKGGRRPSYAQLQSALSALLSAYPGARVTVVVDATFRHRVDADEKRALEADLRESRIVMPPAGWVGAGDTLVLDIAGRQEALVVSNDSYREFQDRYPWVRHGRLLGAALVADEWYFNLRKPPAQRPADAPAAVPAAPRVVQRLPAAPAAPRADLPVGWENSHWWSGE